MIDVIARGMACEAIDAVNNGSALKNNLNAKAIPTKTDDSTKGYKIGSIWIYDGVTYSCISAEIGKASWASSNDMYYFDTWDLLKAAINVTGTTYVNKYATVANANSAPSPEEGVYQAPDAITNSIVDGGSAIFKVITQGVAIFSVECQPRTITNPIVKKVYISAEVKPTEIGYYIFAKTPTDGLPSGVELNDVAVFDGTTWAVFQKYSNATAVLVASSVSSLAQVTWRKFDGTWMSTADEFIPDGLEYQTGKLYNGKAVFRKCYSGTTGTINNSNMSTGITVPTTGTILRIEGTIKRTTGTVWLITSQGLGYSTFNFGVQSDGMIVYGMNQNSSGSYETSLNNCNYTVWAEYTKS